MEDHSRSMSRAISTVRPSATPGCLPTPSPPASSPPLASGASLSQSSVVVQPPTITAAVSNNYNIDSSSPRISEVESSFQDLHVSSQTGSPSQAAVAERHSSPAAHTGTSSYILRVLSQEEELDRNGLVILSSNEADGPLHHYDPDDDEVESEDDEATSEDEVELDREETIGSDKRVDTIQGEDENAEEIGDDEEEEEDDEDIDDEPGPLGDNDEELSLPLPINLSSLGCSDACRSEFQKGIGIYDEQIKRLESKIHELSLDNHTLRANIARLEKKRNSQNRHEPTWHKKLDLYLTNPAHQKALTYTDIYKLCCKEENMSTKTGNVHPNLRLRGPTNNELQADALEGLDTDSVSQDGESEESRHGPEGLFVQDDEHPEDIQRSEGQQPRADPYLKGFPFHRLPAKVQANIIKFVFVEESKLIHCITRLDRFMPPEQPTQTNANRSGLPRRFHLSGTSCNITYGMKPNTRLALLTVCKRWYYFGIHAFYGLNTFAFSSLGEFGRFCTGIGEARRERIQHIELLWVGSQYLTHKPVKEGRKGALKYVSKRTWDVSWLCQLPRLRTLIIHIDESGPQYTRRRHEPKAYADWMASVTAGQPNFRMTRSLRNLQGLHFLHALRGMELIQFYDYNISRQEGGRHLIRDWSFFMDIENVTAMPKTDDKAEAAKLANLIPVLPRYEASQEDVEAIKGLYHKSQAFDAVYVSPPVVERDGEGDIEMADAESQDPVQQRATVASPGGSQANEGTGQPIGRDTLGRSSSPNRSKGPRPGKGKKVAQARSTTPDRDLDGTESEASGEATPKAPTRRVRADTELTTSTLTEESVANVYDRELSLAGSNASNPIDLDSTEPPKMKMRLWRLQQEDNFNRLKREHSDVMSIGHVSAAGSERSYGSENGLFVGGSSPSMSHYRQRRESTVLTDTSRKRGYDELAMRGAIDLMTEDDDASFYATGFPSSSMATSSRRSGNEGIYGYIPPVIQQETAHPRLSRLHSVGSVDDCPFNKRRRH
ncbi:hypothetical protein CABS01_01212 [Colletotrichum abscissum]|uniref:DUF7730 domain-containing protein n=1 Tax=Colletotrichum abscissum TaxID=1671311 RepID=A0A9Q0B047_9PEZI|nr:uncharacterized protein CABS01_01212 [Colletotrichum abscissum]KAI3536339.1 hypothetical protein CABS02_12587 [Colletotrichum abscissum]KAK1505744.1 hypothetical protein CABS01_01212 [Colletotrichum abscissum]